MDQHLSNEILWVEDCEAERFMIKSFILDHALNCNVDFVGTGEEAFGLLRLKSASSTASYLLIVLDINLPCENGVEILTEIRKMAAYRETVAIFFTSSNDQGELRRISGLKAKAYIVKPISLVEYSLIVQSIITDGLSLARDPKSKNLVRGNLIRSA